jgi:hypothetical protein
MNVVLQCAEVTPKEGGSHVAVFRANEGATHGVQCITLQVGDEHDYKVGTPYHVQVGEWPTGAAGKGQDTSISIVLDTQDQGGQKFIDIHDSDGKSIKIGNRADVPGGYSEIKISESDIRNHYSEWTKGYQGQVKE